MFVRLIDQCDRPFVAFNPKGAAPSLCFLRNGEANVAVSFSFLTCGARLGSTFDEVSVASKVDS